MRWNSRLWIDNESVTGTTPSGSAGHTVSRPQNQAELQRINQRRMQLAQKQYSRDVENANIGIGGSNTINMGYLPSNYTDPSRNYYESRSQATSSSFTPVSATQHMHSTPNNYNSIESSNNVSVTQSVSQVSTKDADQERVNLRHQLLFEVLAQVDVDKSKATDVAKRKLNSDGGFAFDWGKLPRIGSVHSVQGIAESSPALSNQITTTSQSQSQSCAEEESTPKEQNLSKEQIPSMSKIKIHELAQLILSGKFDEFLTAPSVGNRNEQMMANKPIDLNNTHESTLSTRAPFASSSQLNTLGTVQPQAITNSTGIITQQPLDDRSLAVVANRIIGQLNRRSMGGNVPLSQTAYNQFSSYNQGSGANNNNAYARSMNNMHAVSNGYVNNVNQGYATVYNQPTQAMANVNHNSARFGSQGQSANFRSQPVHQGQARPAYQRTTSAFSQTPATNLTTLSARRRSLPTVSQTPLGTNQSSNTVNQARTSANLDRAAMKRLKDANIERYRRELLRARVPQQSYWLPSTSTLPSYQNSLARTTSTLPSYQNSLARTARVFPMLSAQNTTASPEPVKSTDPMKDLLETPHDSLTCVDCLLLGTCPIKKSSTKDDEDDVVITKVTTKDAEKGPVERIDVDDWAENASSLPERIKIKQEPADETSCSTTDQNSSTGNTVEHPPARLFETSQQKSFQEVELSPIDETPVFFPIVTQSESLSGEGENSVDENNSKDDTVQKEQEQSDVIGADRSITGPIGEHSMMEQEATSSGDSGPSKSKLPLVECNSNEHSSVENVTTSECSLQETADRREESEMQTNKEVLCSYDDILREIMTPHDKITLTDLERKLEENGNRLNTQTVPWIKKNMMKARLAILKKMERIRNKYELDVQVRMENLTVTNARKTLMALEKDPLPVKDIQEHHPSDKVQQEAKSYEPIELKSKVQVYEEGDQHTGSEDAGVKDEPMTLEEAIKSLDDIPLPNEEEKATRKPNYNTNGENTESNREHRTDLSLNPILMSPDYTESNPEHCSDSSPANNPIVMSPEDTESNRDHCTDPSLSNPNVMSAEDTESNREHCYYSSPVNNPIVMSPEHTESNREHCTDPSLSNPNVMSPEDTESNREHCYDSSPANNPIVISPGYTESNREHCTDPSPSNSIVMSPNYSESNLKHCINSSPRKPNVMSPIYERKESTDISGEDRQVGVELNDKNTTTTQIQNMEKYDQKIRKRRSLDEGECEIKRKKEKTDGASSFNIWERLNSKYSFS